MNYRCLLVVIVLSSGSMTGVARAGGESAGDGLDAFSASEACLAGKLAQAELAKAYV